MPLAVIDCVNVLGCAKCSLLVFTDRLECVIGDYTPNVGKTVDEEAFCPASPFQDARSVLG
jgi:hypothetical protein